MLRLVCSAVLLAALAPGSFAEPASPARVTIYSGDLAWVRETRTLEFAAGRDTARITGLPERIDVSSIRLAPSGKARIRRLAWMAAEPQADRWIERARGRRVRVSLRGDRVVEGVLTGADAAWLMVRGDDGALETLARSAVDQIRMADPPRLTTEPVLEIVLEPGVSGRVPAELSYLTGGLSWTAEHTLVRTGEKTARWSSIVTVENASGRSFDVPRLALVAGQPHRAGGAPMPLMRAGLGVAMEAKADLTEQSFSEYHLYTLDRRARLDDHETQLFTMLEPRAVEVAPRYLARPGAGVALQLQIRNARAAGLGVPLPAGRVRVYEADGGGEERFSGETAIAHTPEGELVTLDVGAAFDLVAERREVANRVISDRERESQIEVRLRNRKTVPVTIVVEEPVAGDHEIVRSTHPATEKDANTLQFSVPLAAGKETVLTYTVRQRF